MSERKKRPTRHPLIQTVIEMQHQQIQDFVRAIGAGDPPAPDTLEMLAGKLSRWLDGEDARELFPKPLGGGRIPRQAIRSKNYRLALKVAIFIPSIGNEDAAIAAVAVAEKVPEGTVKAAFNRHRQASKKQAAAMAAASDNSRYS